jgi:hypothetical protein
VTSKVFFKPYATKSSKWIKHAEISSSHHP